MLAVGERREVAEIVLEEVHSPGGEGAGVLELMIEGGGVAGAGADTGAGVHTELQTLGVDVVPHVLHAVGELLGVGHEVAVLVPLPQGPAVVDDHVLVARVTVALLGHDVGHFQNHLLVDVGAEGVPGVEAHGGRFCEDCHNVNLLFG